MARLGDIGKIITGNTPKTSEALNYLSNDICFIKPSDIVDGEITELTDSEFYISEYARHNARILPPKSVLVTCIGIIGKVAINNVECAFNQQINAIVPDTSKCLTEYLAYAIQNKQKEMQDIANAPVVPILNKTQFSNIEISLPSIELQSQIAAKIVSIDKLISLRKQQLSKLDELIKSRFVELFGDLMENPYGWPVKKIADISLLLKSGLSRKLLSEDIGLPMIRSCNIQNGQFVYDDIKYWYVDDPQGAKTSDYVLDDGDILINFINSMSQIGKTAIFCDVGRECIYTTNIFRMKLAPTCNKYFYNWFAMTEYYYRQLQNIIQPAVNQASFTTVNFLNLSIPLPPIELQEQFADFVEQTDKSKLAIQKSLEQLETLKKSLMQKYFG